MVLPPYVALTILLGSVVLWVAGLRLFLRSQLSRARKASWSAFLVFVGFGIGLFLPLEWIWRRFLILMLSLPVLAMADVWLLRSRRRVSFWVRACGFEVCTVFGTAVVARYWLDWAGVTAFLRRTG